MEEILKGEKSSPKFLLARRKRKGFLHRVVAGDEK
jgi:hypothetical protein